MATNKTATAAAAAGKAAAKAAPAPVVVVQGLPLYTYQPYNGSTNMGWPAGQRGYRQFACQVAQALAKAQPKGFTLPQYRAALVASAAASTLPLPKGGWQRHNMPQWAAAQKWLVPAAAPVAKPAKAKAAAPAPVAAPVAAPAAAPAPAPAQG